MTPNLRKIVLAGFGLAVCAAIAGAAGRGHARPDSAAGRKVTFSSDVAAILYKNCSTCHHAGEVAPFPLMSYEDARKRAKQIAAVVKSRTMPPWKAESHGEFRNESWLPESDVAAIQAWAADGAPLGDAKSAPAAPKYAEGGWHIGKPDQVLALPEPFHLDAEGKDVYRCFVIPSGATEDKFISGMEFHPGNRTVVHHVIAYLDTTGTARKLAAKDPGQGYSSSGGGPGFIPSAMLSGWAPGNDPGLLPDGMGVRLPKGGDIVLEVHYHKSGKPETDLTTVGVKYCDKPVEKAMRILAIVNLGLNIPAGEANFMTSAVTPVGQDITIYGVTPHMHLLGREMTVTAEMPDGSKKRLVRVPDWDFNWQTFYGLKEPMKVPAGTKLTLTARYDNSSGNPRNPNSPPKAVHWGEQTTDEMCLAFVGFTVDSESLTKGIRGKRASLFELGSD